MNGHILLLSWVSVGRSESVNIYFVSHDIRHVLYLVLLYDDNLFNHPGTYMYICECACVGGIIFRFKI